MKKVNSAAVEEVFGVNEFGEGPLMENHRAVDLAEGVEKPENEEELIRAWQHLHNTGLAYQLQGWFGRQAERMIQAGLINA